MHSDPVICSIIKLLQSKYKCHTAILYGSRVRGDIGPVSDYDVVGICKSGSKTRVAQKKDGAYWDLFVYPEKDVSRLSQQHLGWRNAEVLFEKGTYGRQLVRRIQSLVKKPFKPDPQYEIDVTIAWADKQLERIAVGDIQGHYRKIELQTSALEHYFQIRRRRYWGPKASLQWLEKNDPAIFKLFAKAYKKPGDMKELKSLVKEVYKGI